MSSHRVVGERCEYLLGERADAPDCGTPPTWYIDAGPSPDSAQRFYSCSEHVEWLFGDLVDVMGVARAPQPLPAFWTAAELS